MKAVVWRSPGVVEVSEVSDPQLLTDTDAIVRVTLSSICGTDLHAYRGQIPDFRPGTILGHEFVGEVLQVGPAVRELNVGDRVLASDLIACGKCWWCARGWHYHCKDGSLFGYGTVVGEDIAGGQAELVRVPYAEVVLSRIDPALRDQDAILIGDVLATAFCALLESGLSVGGSLAVVGCGPVGLCSVMCASVLGAAAVLAVDPNPARATLAETFGATVLSGDPSGDIGGFTNGRGADVVIEAVGTEEALSLALELVRPRGTVVVVGAHHSTSTPISTQDAFARELAVKFVVGNPIAVRNELTGLVSDGLLKPAEVLSHSFELADAADAYRLFDQRRATKVTLTP